jgi:ATP-binding cassette subfamily B protein/subfamily B ATP-binding cassette protein MsbA
MNDYDQEEATNGKLYNREVLRLLFRYIVVYKKYLFFSLAFVLIITAANLLVPYVLKTIVDRYIFKTGRVLTLESSAGTQNMTTLNSYRGQRLRLDDRHEFLFQSRLNYYSRAEIDSMQEQGVLSRERYVLVESPELTSGSEKKLEGLVKVGRALSYGDSIYLIDSRELERFTAREVAEIRALDFTRILQYFAGILLVLLVQFAASYSQIMLLMKLSQRAMRDLRDDLFSHIIGLEASYYDRNKIGKLVTRVTNDIEVLNELFSSVLVTLFQDILIMLGIAAVMFFTSFRLAIVVSISFPFVVLITIIFRIKVRSAYRLIRSKISELNSFLNETITGIRIIQIFVRETKNLISFRKKNIDVYGAQLKQLYTYAVFRPLIGFLRWFSIAAVIYFSARGIGAGTLSYGILVMFVAYVERFFAPVQDLSEKFDIMQSANAAGEKILSILKTDAINELGAGKQRKETPAHPEKGPLRREKTERFEGKIEFDNVWFSYNESEWILKGVSFSIDPKKTLAIVGKTGAGKTTIINLLARFYPVQKGRILIDGVDITEFPLPVLRRNIISVMQDVFLFSRTVKENVILGSPFDEEWFRTVCRLTHIDRFIGKLHGGEDEPVMERGSTFSAGERQLLSFARALYFDPSILVLDEATASIDTETEKLVQDAITHITKGRTSIAIAHRLSTIQHADKIIVLDGGRIVEEGNHQELLHKKGIYHKLYTIQFSNLS